VLFIDFKGKGPPAMEGFFMERSGELEAGSFWPRMHE